MTGAEAGTGHVEGRRAELVRRAAASWAAQIVDLGGRNTLLFYRDLRAGTLDLTPSDTIDAASVRALLDGRTVRLSRLAADGDATALARRARTVRAKATSNFEERGLETLFLAHGMATWQHARSDATPAAPLLLAPLRLTARGGSAEDFDLAVADDWDVNPTLLHLLATDFGVVVDPDEVLGPEGGGEVVFDRLLRAAADVPGLSISPRVVVGNFSYAKQPLALDLQAAVEAMIAHPLVSAIAGDDTATRELIARQPVVELHDVAAAPPDDEFLILDADASQSLVIDAALRGANLVVQGPPGTGKSQTIANLIAALAANGKSVLFVAEKRAAIDAVVGRLDRSGLGDLVLDLHGGTASRRTVLAELNRALEGFGAVPAVDVGGLHRRLDAARTQLDTHVDALHTRREPFGLSVFDMQAHLLGLPADAQTATTLPRATVERIAWVDLDAIEGELVEWVRLGGSQLGHGVHPWEAGAGRVTSPEHAERALELTQSLANDVVPTATRELTLLVAECGLARPATVAGWGDLLGLVGDTRDLLERSEPELFELDLDALVAALRPAERSAPGRAWATMFDGAYRAAKRSLRAVARSERSAPELRVDAERARDVRARWHAARVDGGDPRVPDSFDRSTGSFSTLTTQLAAAGAYLGDDGAGRELEEIRSRMAALVADRAMLFRLPRLHELQTRLEEAGLAGVLAEIRARRLDGDAAGTLLRATWLRSALDVVSISDPAIGSFDGTAHIGAVATFQESDRAHISSGALRVRRKVAEQAVAAMNEHVDQAQLVRQQAARKRGHRPLRELLQLAPDVLVAVKPCWAMSPLVVAQLLPGDEPLFDVVIFDEASQIPPAEAIPAILRGRTVVVAGDSRQLPPTAFFSSISDAEPPPDDDVVRVTDDMESILDSVVALLPPPHGSRSLAWHYRSRDERLIAFSNAQPSLYDWTMTTFPGVAGGEAIRHVHVPWRPDGPDQEVSATDEVDAVLDLIVDHARRRPGESLGVITMGIKHADRVSEAVRLRRKTDEVLDGYCASHPDEPFFVKNLERVQGDERDATILSIGYGKTADGRMLYRFGPVNQQGGERRLNVAITRSRSRMTVVSAFTADDLDDDRLRSEGARMLKRYLAYAASNGTELGSVARPRPALDPFEQDVHRHLAAAGLVLTPRLGASGHWIDFAAAHPDRPGRFVLAIEGDGGPYHASATARDRDRLRQEHLERLGWVFHRIWSTDWFNRRDQEIERAVRAWEQAVRAHDRRAVGTAEEPPPQPARGEAFAPPAIPRRSGRRPTIIPGEPITSYSDRDLDDLIRWLRSDTLLRTDDELLELAIDELGYARRGTRIVAALTAAIERTAPEDARPPAATAGTASNDARSEAAPPPTGQAPGGSWAPPSATHAAPHDRTPGWKSDPTHRYEYRYWDGSAWTAHAARAGSPFPDPL